MNKEVSWIIKRNLGFVCAVLVGVILFEYSYYEIKSTGYYGAENIVFTLQLCMGCGSSGWNGVVFPILAALPMAMNYVREYKTGYIKIRFTKQSKKKYTIQMLLKNGILGGGALLIPFVILVIHLYLDKGIGAPLMTEQGLTVVKFMTSFAEANPIGYMIYQGVQVFLCGVVFSTFSLGISTLVKNEFLTVLLPFALCISVAILTPDFSWDLLLLYCVNAYSEVSLFKVCIMGTLLLITGVILFVVGVNRNEYEDDKDVA